MDWLGENQKLYRDVLKCFNRYASVVNRTSTSTGYALSGLDLQVMECLYENSEKQLMMAQIADALGIATSSFTKIVAKLTKLGFAEKFHRDGNRKNIIVLLSDAGRDLFAHGLAHSQGWIHEFKASLEEKPERAEYYAELLQFFLNWMEVGDRMIDAESTAKLIPIDADARE